MRSLDIVLRRSVLDSWLGVVVRVGALSGCGLGLTLVLGVGAMLATFYGLSGLTWYVLCPLLGGFALPLLAVPLFALLFVRFSGRRLRIHGDEARLLGPSGKLIAKASVASMRASVKKGRYDEWGRRGLVVHLGVGREPLAIGTLDPDAHRSQLDWPIASAPNFECTPSELETLLRTLAS